MKIIRALFLQKILITDSEQENKTPDQLLDLANERLDPCKARFIEMASEDSLADAFTPRGVVLTQEEADRIDADDEAKGANSR